MKWNDWSNIPQNAEHGCPRTVAPPFGGLDSARASLQIAPLTPRDVACKEKKDYKLNIFISNNKLINDIFHLN